MRLKTVLAMLAVVAPAMIATNALAASASDVGPYVGLSIGTSTSQSTGDAYMGPLNLKPEGTVFKVLVGDDVAVGDDGLAIGVEMAFQAGNVSASDSYLSCSTADGCPTNETATLTKKVDGQVLVGGTVSDQFGRVKVTFRGGLAAQRSSYTECYDSGGYWPSACYGTQSYELGLYGGAGVGYAFTDHLTGSLNWQHVEANRVQYTGTYGGSRGGSKGNTFDFGLIYKF